MEAETEKDTPIRLQLYLARSGIGSRRRCENYISEGRVKVNGAVVREKGVKVRPLDRILFDGKPVSPQQVNRYIALHKPPRYICSSDDPEGRALALDLLTPHFEERLYNVGRLDFMSEGLILFTNDGEFARKAGHPSSEIEKEYVVYSSEKIDEASTKKALENAKRGVEIDGVRYRIEDYAIGNSTTLRIILIEGKNREIRRICKEFGIALQRLVRTRIGPISLEGIPFGAYRNLSTREVAWFLNRNASS